MARALEVARALAGICLLTGALAVARLTSVEQGGLAPAVSAAEMSREARPTTAVLGASSGLVRWSGR